MPKGRRSRSGAACLAGASAKAGLPRRSLARRLASGSDGAGRRAAAVAITASTIQRLVLVDIPDTEQQSRLPTVEIAHNGRKRRFAGLEADRERDFPCLIRRNELLDQQKPEIHGRPGASRGEDIPVNDHAFAGQDVRQLAGYGEMGGVAAAVEQSCGVKDGGRGADCRDPFAGRGMSPDRGVDPRIGAEILDAGASGQEQQVEKMSADLRQGRIRMQRDSVIPLRPVTWR